MILSLHLLVLAAMQPAGPEWRELDATPDRQYSWDANGVVRGGEMTTVRLRRQPGHAGAGPDSYAISRIEIRCAAGLIRVVETVTYSADGREVGRDTRETQFDRIPQGSIINLVQAQVCAPPAPVR
jgi:hypothetical protein